MINEAQMRAARSLLDWTQSDLAEKSGLSAPTIKRMEKIGLGRSSMDNVLAVQRALENAGVSFIPENGGGVGVRLSKPIGNGAPDKTDKTEKTP